jgi:hypothetical protein
MDHDLLDDPALHANVAAMLVCNAGHDTDDESNADDGARTECGNGFQEPYTHDDEAALHHRNQLLIQQAVEHGAEFDPDSLEAAADAAVHANPHLTPEDAADEIIMNMVDILGNMRLDDVDGASSEVSNPVTA